MPNQFKIYRSSAGSGKTYTLVKEYLQLALQKPDNYRHVLAVTFTNKATAEMKSRILEKLSDLAKGTDAGFAEELKKSLSFSEEELKERAHRVLKSILHDYSAFAVTTIDSFFYKIIRSFSKELKIPLRHEIEMDTGLALTYAADKLMLEMGSNKEMLDWLEELVEKNISEEKSWHIDRPLKELGRELFKEQYRQLSPEENQKQQVKELVKKLYVTIHNFEEKMDDCAGQALKLIEEKRLNPGDFRRGSVSFFEKIKNRDYCKGSLDDLLNTTIRNIHSGEMEWHTKTSPKATLIEEIAENGLNRQLQAAWDCIEQNYKGYITALQVLRNIHLFAILDDLNEKLKEYRDEQQLLFFSDVTQMLTQIVAGSDPPFIYEKTGSYFHHFLLDEFQDTSNFQWHNLLPLIKNALGSGYSALIVGDVKQSIYRWRGGNPNLLMRQVEEVDLKPFQELIKPEVLNKNYRSRKEIVDFNNAFFEKTKNILINEFTGAGAKEVLQSAYREHIQQLPEKVKDKGYVNIRLFESDRESRKIIHHWQEKAKTATVEKIHQLQDMNYNLQDITILVNKNKEGREMADFLVENNIPVISSESLLLSASPKINFLSNLLKYIADPRDKIIQTQVLNYYISEIRKENFPSHTIFRDHKDGEAAFAQYLPGLSGAGLHHLIKLPLYQLVEQLIQLFELNMPVDAYIQGFQDMVLQYSAKNTPELSEFLSWWEENKDKDEHSVTVPEGEEAITIMTIHKAKGLQFPVVIMPFANWGFAPKNIVWLQSDAAEYAHFAALPLEAGNALQESLFGSSFLEEQVQSHLEQFNKLYVALTRAVDQLYIFTEKSERKNGALEVKHLINGISKNASLFAAHDKDENHFEKGVSFAKELIGKISSIKRIKIEGAAGSRLSNYNVKHNYKAIFDENDQRQAQISRGNLLHNILAEIKTADDVGPALEKASMQGWVSRDESDSLRAELEEILQMEEVQDWFTSGAAIFTEKDILLPKGNIHRPDRVLIKDNEAIVIDYKTGAPSEQHKQQISGYARTLTDMGYGKVKKYLLYIENRELIEVY